MDYGPLVMEEIDAGLKLAHEFDHYRTVKAAFWLKADDEDPRYLYLASDQIDDANLREAYREVLLLAAKIQSPFLDPFRVKLIRGDAPLARAAVELKTRFPGPMSTRFGGTLFGGQFVEDAYVYPTPLPVAV